MRLKFTRIFPHREELLVNRVAQVLCSKQPFPTEPQQVTSLIRYVANTAQHFLNSARSGRLISYLQS